MDRTKSTASLNNLAFRRQIIDWRDKHTEDIDSHLNAQISVLFNAIKKELSDAKMKNLLVTKKAYAKEHIEPLYQEWIQRETDYLIEKAQQDLQIICTHFLEYKNNSIDLEHDEKSNYDDVGKAAFGLGGAAIAIPATITSMTVSAGSVLGLIGLTTISWPIAIVGFTAAVGFLAFGGQSAANLKKKTAESYQNQLETAISRQVFGCEDCKSSIRQRLQEYIAETAEVISKGFDL